MSIGTDLHKPQVTACFLKDENTSKTDVFFFRDGGIQRLQRRLAKYRKDGWHLSLAVETTGNSEYFVTQIQDFVDEVKILNTVKTHALIKSHKKTDENDARAIALLLSKGIFTDEYCVRTPSASAKEMRVLIKTRQCLVRAKTAIINQIHGILLSTGEETKKRFLTSQIGRDRLRTMEHPRSQTLNVLVDQIENLSEQIVTIKEALSAVAVSRKEDIEIVQSIPGVGESIATSLVAAIDDVNRFATPDKLTANFGLVPCVKNSSDKVWHGATTKIGPAYARTALVQAVLAMLRCKDMEEHPLVKHYYHLKERKGSGKAIIATARKLAKITWILLKRREMFDASLRYKKVIHHANQRNLVRV